LHYLKLETVYCIKDIIIFYLVVLGHRRTESN
jgi:hypothetical protein